MARFGESSADIDKHEWKEVKKMTEQDRRQLQNFLAEEAEKQSRLKQSQEQVRQELENRARQAIEKYKQELEELTPIAKEKVTTIIQPWFDELVRDGTYDQLLEWQKAHDARDILVSDSILYYWPDKALRGFRQSEGDGKKPFEFAAEYVVENYKDHQEGIEKHQDGVDEVWSARFHIAPVGSYIAQWPMVGGGYNFAVSRSRDLEIAMDVKNIGARIPYIHPDVWLGFADQIENGKAMNVLKESLLTKPIRVVEYGSTERKNNAREHETRRAEYLKARTARGK